MTKTVWTFNRGEWTEAYVFLKLLANGKIYGATKELKKNPDVYVDIVNILRYDTQGLLKFHRENNDTVTASLNDVEFKIICCAELSEKATFLYNTIKDVNAGKISISAIQEYLESLNFSQPKAPKMPPEAEERFGKKTDIIIESKDPVDHAVVTEGFSIKSHIGSASTLFNSASNSGLVYRITGCDDEIMACINAIESETGIFTFIKNDNRLTLDLIGSKSPAFAENLEFIDLRMIEFINAILLVQIGYLPKAKTQKSADIVKCVSELNPLNVARPERWYASKFKEFLFDAFSGLTAIQPWDGHRRMSGGYIDVSKDGEILYFRAMSDYVFSEYLYQNTFIDRPSRGVMKDIAQAKANAYLKKCELTEDKIQSITAGKAKKGDWGYVWKENDEYYIAINFQIRFR